MINATVARRYGLIRFAKYVSCGQSARACARCRWSSQLRLAITHMPQPLKSEQKRLSRDNARLLVDFWPAIGGRAVAWQPRAAGAM